MTVAIPRTITGGFVLLFLSLNSAAVAGAFEDERRWLVQTTPSGEFVRAVTHGALVYGNEFGFLLSRPSCERKVIWLSFTSYELDESAEGTVATFELVAPDTKRRTVQVPLLAVVQLLSGPNSVRMLPFTNRPFEPGLTEFLRASKEMGVRIAAPEWLVEAVDVPADRFDLTGFAEAEEAAAELCRSEK